MYFEIKLSRREKQVLELISAGSSISDIADELFISPETVKTYRSSLIKKLEAKNCANLIRIAFERGMFGYSNWHIKSYSA